MSWKAQRFYLYCFSLWWCVTSASFYSSLLKIRVVFILGLTLKTFLDSFKKKSFTYIFCLCDKLPVKLLPLDLNLKLWLKNKIFCRSVSSSMMKHTLDTYLWYGTVITDHRTRGYWYCYMIIAVSEQTHVYHVGIAQLDILAGSVDSCMWCLQRELSRFKKWRFFMVQTSFNDGNII